MSDEIVGSTAVEIRANFTKFDADLTKGADAAAAKAGASVAKKLGSGISSGLSKVGSKITNGLKGPLSKVSGMFSKTGRDAQAGLNKINTNKAQGALGKLGISVKGLLVSFGALFAAKAIFNWAKSTVSTFRTVGAEVLKLSRITGTNVETASKLRFIAQQSGIDAGKLSKSFVLLSKNISSGAVAKLGIDLKGANGKMLPLDATLSKLADKFAKLPDGVAKNTLAVKLFGKTGTDLIPLLNKGSAGIEELKKKAQELGIVLTEDDAKALKEATKNQRLWQASLEALKVRIGRDVLPIANSLTTGLIATLGPILGGITKPLASAFSSAFLAVGPLLSGLGPLIGQILTVVATAFSGIATAAQPLLKILSDIAGIIVNVLGPPLGTLGGVVRGVANAFKLAFAGFGAGVGPLKLLAAAMKPVAGFLQQLVDKIGHALGAAINVVGPAIGEFVAGLIFAARTVLPPLITGIAALIQGLAPLLPIIAKVATLILGVLSSAITDLATAFAKVLPSITIVATTLANAFVGAIGKLVPLIVKLGPLFIQSFAAILKAVVPAIGVVAKALLSVAPLFNVIVSAVGGILTSLQPIFPKIVALVTTLAKALSGALVKVLPVLADGLGKLLTALAPLIPAAAQIAVAMQGALVGALVGLVKVLAPILPLVIKVAVTLGGALAKAFQMIAPLISEVAKILIGGISKILPPLIKAFLGLVSAVTPLIPIVVQVVSVVGKALLTAFVKIVDAVAPFLPIVTELAKILGGVLGAALQAMAPILAKIAGVFAGVLSKILPIVAKALLSVVKAIEPLLDPKIIASLVAVANPFLTLFEVLGPVLPVVGKLAGILVGALGGALSTILPVIVKLVRAFAVGLAPALPQLSDALVQIADSLVQVLQAVIPILPPIIKLAALLLEKIGVPLIIVLAKAFVVLAVALAKVATVLTTVIGWAAKLVSAFTHLNFAKIAADIGNAFLAIGRFFQGAPAKIGSFLTGLPGMVGRGLVRVVSAIATWAGQAGGKIVAAVAVLGPKLLGFIGNAIAAAPGLMVRFVGEVLKNVVTMPFKLTAALIGVTAALLKGIVDAAIQAPGKFITLVTAIVSGVRGIGRAVGRAAVGIFSGVWGEAKKLPGQVAGFLLELPGKIVKLGDEFFTAAVGLGKTIIDGLLAGLGGAGKAIGSLATSMGKVIGDLGKKMINGVIDALNDLLPDHIGKIVVAGRTIFGGLDLPKDPIPRLKLAKGGIVPQTPGGVPSVLGDGRTDEAAIPLPPGVLEGLKAIGEGKLGGGDGIHVGQLILVGKTTAQSGIDVLQAAKKRKHLDSGTRRRPGLEWTTFGDGSQGWKKTAS